MTPIDSGLAGRRSPPPKDSSPVSHRRGPRPGRVVPDMTNESNPPPSPPDAAIARVEDRPRVLKSEEILRGETEIWITHAGETYRLRETRKGKLILYK